MCICVDEGVAPLPGLPERFFVVTNPGALRTLAYCTAATFVAPNRACRIGDEQWREPSRSAGRASPRGPRALYLAANHRQTPLGNHPTSEIGDSPRLASHNAGHCEMRHASETSS